MNTITVKIPYQREKSSQDCNNCGYICAIIISLLFCPIKITLPSGVKVIVDRQGWGLNLYVWAPADPENPSEGLCGDNNGNPDDDFGLSNAANLFGERWRYC